MARLGPWPADQPDYPVGLAVSGGADSLCLAFLARRWRRSVLAFVVDHGLRPESRAEAEATCTRLAALGIKTERLDLSGLRPGPGLQARARKARYVALTHAAVRAGCVDLLLGHHARDQAETLLIRRRSKSGPDGLAGMASSREGDMLRFVRPLLEVMPETLRARLHAENLDWIEDPSNNDPRYERVRYRRRLTAGRIAHVLRFAAACGQRRMAREGELARNLARAVLVHSQNWALAAPHALGPSGWARLIAALVDSQYDIAERRLLTWIEQGENPLTIGGGRILRGGRVGARRILCVEKAGAAPMRPAKFPGAPERLPAAVLAALPAAGCPLEIVTSRAATSNSYWG